MFAKAARPGGLVRWVPRIARDDSMALSFDPQKLPVLGVDDHLPAVAPDNLLPAALRRYFAVSRIWVPEIVAEPRFTERAAAHAAVLVALVPSATDGALSAEHPEVYRQRSGGIILPEDADWIESTRELRKAYVEHPELDPAVAGRLAGAQ